MLWHTLTVKAAVAYDAAFHALSALSYLFPASLHSAVCTRLADRPNTVPSVNMTVKLDLAQAAQQEYGENLYVEPVPYSRTNATKLLLIL